MMRLKLKSHDAIMPGKPEDLQYDINNLNIIDGQTKSFEGLPKIYVSTIEAFAHRITAAVDPNRKSVKRHFQRGELFLDENFIDVGSIYATQSDKLFCLKAVCTA